MFKIFVYLVGLAILASSAGCGTLTPSKVDQKEDIVRDIPMRNIQKDFIETIGIGAADPNVHITTQRMSLSRDAAIAKARAEMLAIVKGLQLDGKTTVARAILTDQRLEETIHGLIIGAEIIRTQWTSDDGCVVTLRLDRKRLDEILKKYRPATR